ncbi:MAG: hypothetical protein QOG71_3032 [Pyrinomonadaceae bacterium]|nr:hypothetical protein [Pyrinomonadaceae bacterium]
MINCKICGSTVPDSEAVCLTCGTPAGTPNVRSADRPEELQALEERYRAAYETARDGNYLSILEEFDKALKQTHAVINVDVEFLHFFTRNARNLYTTYERAVEGQMRKPALLEFDQKRRAVGGGLFGSYAREISYAALSLDGSGPQSYGSYAMKLRDIAIRNRATVLENNSYDFVQKNDLKPGKNPPLGYVASWDNRHKLAVAKLGEFLTPTTTVDDFPKLLLSSAGSRATDEFIEVLIYGTFDFNAIESVKGSSTIGSRDDRDLLRMVKQHLSRAGKEWIEG